MTKPRPIPGGYRAHEDAWYGYASGPNRYKHRVRVCCKTGRLDIIGPDGRVSLRKSLNASAATWGFPLLIGTPRVVETLSKKLPATPNPQSPAPSPHAKKSPDYGEHNAAGERWITVHPNGDSEAGHPVKIKLNPDGSHTIVGGAGGALNGLRLTGLKSPEHYKDLAKQRQTEKRAKAAQQKEESREALHARHRDELSKELLSQGRQMTMDDFKKEAAKRADTEWRAQEKARQDRAGELKQAQHDAEKQMIQAVAKAQGWQPEEYELSGAALDKAREVARQEILRDSPTLQAALASDKPDRVEAANAQLKQKTDAAVERLQAIHHQKVLQRVSEVRDNVRQSIVAAHEDLSHDTLGDLQVGDLARDTLGDGGKGYAASLADEAEARGIDIDALRQQAGEASYNELLRRKDGDVEAAAKARAGVEKMQAAAARSREQISRVQEQLGAQGEHLEKVKQLATLPAAGDIGANAKLLAQLKTLEGQAQAAREGARQAKEGTGDLETLPTAAVVAARPLSPDEAMRQVQQDLAESARQSAVSDLVDLYNAQDQLSPLGLHRTTGHSAFFSNIGNIVGIQSPDPLYADVLGAAGTAAVMRRAMEQSFRNADGSVDQARLRGVAEALKEHHIGQQVQLCREATENANGFLQVAEHIQIMPPDSLDSLLAGLSQNQRKIELVRQARQEVGVALGRMEAAAALNHAFMDNRGDDLQVALGAIGMEDALARAHAIGLTQADTIGPDGSVAEAGQFHIYDDGKNKILRVHQGGLDTLADGLREDPAYLERARTADAVKGGKQDEAGWLPHGFSRRPRLDLSAEQLQLGDTSVPPLDLSNLTAGDDTDEDAGGTAGGASTVPDIAGRLMVHIAQRIEAGQDPVNIASDIRSQSFQSAHVPGPLRDAYRAALNDVAPPLARVRDPDEAKALVQAQRERFARYHDNWLQLQVESGKLSSAEASVHRQTLPQDWQTRDLLYQIAVQDPRLQYAYRDVGELGRDGNKAVRDYAQEHIFQLKGKEKSEPITPLTPAERRGWENWNKLAQTSPDTYQAIQDHWRQAESGDENAGGSLGMFADAIEPHPFATVDLHDDEAVVAAARKEAKALGYEPERRVTDLARRQYEDVVPELEVTPERSLQTVANEARRRIQGALRDYAFRQMLGAPELAGQAKPTATFNPDNVKTVSERWGQYVADMGGEERAYRTVLEKMRGDVAGRFAKGYRQWKGEDFRTVAVPLTHADAHAMASVSPERRLELQADKARQQAQVRKREGGHFAAEGEGAVAAKLEAQHQASLMGDDLFSADEGKTQSQKLDTSWLSLGAAAENMVKGLMPAVHLRQGTVAAGDIDMSSPTGIKRQRGIKYIKAVKRGVLTLGVGTGKTSCALGLHSDLKQEGKVKRSIMVVPSIAQEQFGSEASRFYDMTADNAPHWHADSTATPEERRAAYRDDSGHDICVVTPQALRDDLTWALAHHRFNGDTDAARQFLATAPEQERNAAMQEATSAHGWNFDLAAVDESQALLNRQGKENSAMANAIDAFTAHHPYYLSMSGDPVRNDASEAFDLLHKVDPQRYVADDHPHARSAGRVSKSAFLRKYGVNTLAAKEALQRELAPYQYAEAAPPVDDDGNPLDKTIEPATSMLLTAPQQKAYDDVTRAYQRARAARLRGDVDVDAIRHLSPQSFDGIAADQQEAHARHLADSLGMLRDSAHDRVVNLHPDGVKMQRLMNDLKAHPPDQEPPIVFAHSLAAVDMLHDQLKAAGYRVGKLRGDMNGKEKERVKLQFSPQWDDAQGRYVTDPEHDILVTSDAGAVGMNAQRGRQVIAYDTPYTALLHEQRIGRAYRTGQRHHVRIADYVTDTEYERRRRRGLAYKGALRQALTTPAELIDDSGLAQAIHQRVDRERSLLVANAAQAAAQAAGDAHDAASAQPLTKSLSGVPPMSWSQVRRALQTALESGAVCVLQKSQLALFSPDGGGGSVPAATSSGGTRTLSSKPRFVARGSALKGKHRIGGTGPAHRGSHWTKDEAGRIKDEGRIPAVITMQRPDVQVNHSDPSAIADEPLFQSWDYHQHGVRAQSFKKWFGDWEHDPQHASQVVNAGGEPQPTAPVAASQVMRNGRPVVVYHGSGAGRFSAFDPQRADSEALFGPGFYFTEDREVATGTFDTVPKFRYFESKAAAEKAPHRTQDVWREDFGPHKGQWTALTREPMIAGYGYQHKGIVPAPEERGALLDRIAGDLAAQHRGHIIDDAEYQEALTSIEGYRNDDRADLRELTEHFTVTYQIPARQYAQELGLWDRGHVHDCYLNIRHPVHVDEPLTAKTAERLAEAIERLYKVDEMPDMPGMSATAMLRELGHNNDHASPSAAADSDADGLTTVGDALLGIGDSVTVERDGVSRSLSKRDYQELMRASGYDGMSHIGGSIVGDHPHRVWIAFEPTQIKAVDNVGTFNPATADIFKSLAPVVLRQNPSGEAL